jgi:hypothetical protein
MYRCHECGASSNSFTVSIIITKFAYIGHEKKSLRSLRVGTQGDGSIPCDICFRSTITKAGHFQLCLVYSLHCLGVQPRIAENGADEFMARLLNSKCAMICSALLCATCAGRASLSAVPTCQYSSKPMTLGFSSMSNHFQNHSSWCVETQCKLCGAASPNLRVGISCLSSDRYFHQYTLSVHAFSCPAIIIATEHFKFSFPIPPCLCDPDGISTFSEM